MDTSVLENQAIEAALSANWELARDLNQKIIENNPNHIPALNRLARVEWEFGQVEAAQKLYKRVLELDKYNPIAAKNLKRLCQLKLGKSSFCSSAKTSQSIDSNLFLKEPGKTKVVKLLRLTTPEVLSQLDNGDEVVITPRCRCIVITKDDKTYLGTLPDDVTKRLTGLIKGGNHYQAYIKAVDRQALEIIIKETFRSRKFRNAPSFL